MNEIQKHEGFRRVIRFILRGASMLLLSLTAGLMAGFFLIKTGSAHALVRSISGDPLAESFPNLIGIILGVPAAVGGPGVLVWLATCMVSARRSFSIPAASVSAVAAAVAVVASPASWYQGPSLAGQLDAVATGTPWTFVDNTPDDVRFEIIGADAITADPEGGTPEIMRELTTRAILQSMGEHCQPQLDVYTSNRVAKLRADCE